MRRSKRLWDKLLVEPWAIAQRLGWVAQCDYWDEPVVASRLFNHKLLVQEIDR